MPAWAVTQITAACNRDYEPARRRQPRLIVLSVESVTDAGLFPRFDRSHFRDRFRMYRYFVETLLIATTSRTTISAPITVQIHIPPLIPPYAWFIIEPFRSAQPSSTLTTSPDASVLSGKASVHLWI